MQDSPYTLWLVSHRRFLLRTRKRTERDFGSRSGTRGLTKERAHHRGPFNTFYAPRCLFEWRTIEQRTDPVVLL